MTTKEKCKACKVVIALCLFVAVGLMVAGFIVPPTGVIDGSVLKGCGILFLFATLPTVIHAVELGYDMKISNGETAVELNNN